MDSSKPSKRLSQIIQTTLDAADIAQTFFKHRENLTINYKDPTQAVTQADQEVEAVIRSAINKDFPGEAIVGEEFGGQSAESFWAIDPIDGTANFLNGLPLWGIAIGHIGDGVPDLGVICLPELQLTISAENEQLFVNGKQFNRKNAAIPSVSLGQADAQCIAESLEIHQRYRDAGISVYHWRCSALSLAWTAMGKISGHLDRQTTLWDAVPGAALCNAARLDVRMNKLTDAELWIKTGEPAIHKPIGHLWEVEPSRAR